MPGHACFKRVQATFKAVLLPGLQPTMPRVVRIQSSPETILLQRDRELALAYSFAILAALRAVQASIGSCELLLCIQVLAVMACGMLLRSLRLSRSKQRATGNKRAQQANQGNHRMRLVI